MADGIENDDKAPPKKRLAKPNKDFLIILAQRRKAWEEMDEFVTEQIKSNAHAKKIGRKAKSK